MALVHPSTSSIFHHPVEQRSAMTWSSGDSRDSTASSQGSGHVPPSLKMTWDWRQISANGWPPLRTLVIVEHWGGAFKESHVYFKLLFNGP